MVFMIGHDLENWTKLYGAHTHYVYVPTHRLPQAHLALISVEAAS